MSEMIYRSLPRGGEKISILGMGMGSIHESSEQEIISVLSKAIDCGMNYFDMAASEDIVYPAYGKAFRGRRSKVFLQMHFGAVFDENGMKFIYMKRRINWEAILFLPELIILKLKSGN